MLGGRQQGASAARRSRRNALREPGARGGGMEMPKAGLLTLILVNVAVVLDGADSVLLPAVYREVGMQLGVSPTALGTLTTVRRLVETLCYPASAYVAMHYNRPNTIAAGVLIWAASTLAAGCSQTYLQLALTRSVCGVGLALAFPAILSTVADLTEVSNRGSAFSWTYVAYTAGVMSGGSLAVLLAGTTVLGVQGWRIAFFLVALVSAAVALMVYMFVVDPRPAAKRVADGKKGQVWLQLKAFGLTAKKIVQTRSFQVIVAQGIPGTTPGAAMAFCPMWLELVGFSHRVTAMILTVDSFARAIGALVGGQIADFLAKHFPDSGRIFLAQVKSALAVPLAAILFLMLPRDPSTALEHGGWLVLMGLLVSGMAPSTNGPICSEVVEESGRTTVYALDRFFESLFASFATQLVGLLAERAFGYESSPIGNVGGVSQDRSNAVALGKALFTCFFLGYGFCCIMYTFLYWTYPKDRDRVRYGLIQHKNGEDFEAEDDNDSYSELKSLVAHDSELQAYSSPRSTWKVHSP